DRRPRGLGKLCGRPDLALAPDDVRYRVRHLHWRMRIIGHEIISRDAVRGGGQRVVDITLVAHDSAGLLRRRLELPTIGARIVACIGTKIPGDLKLLATLLRRPGVAGNDCDATQR